MILVLTGHIFSLRPPKSTRLRHVLEVVNVKNFLREHAPTDPQKISGYNFQPPSPNICKNVLRVCESKGIQQQDALNGAECDLHFSYKIEKLLSPQ